MIKVNNDSARHKIAYSEGKLFSAQSNEGYDVSVTAGTISLM